MLWERIEENAKAPANQTESVHIVSTTIRVMIGFPRSVISFDIDFPHRCCAAVASFAPIDSIRAQANCIEPHMPHNHQQQPHYNIKLMCHCTQHTCNIRKSRRPATQAEKMMLWRACGNCAWRRRKHGTNVCTTLPSLVPSSSSLQCCRCRCNEHHNKHTDA